VSPVKIIWDGAVMENIMHGPDGIIGRFMWTRSEIVKRAAVLQVNKRTRLLSRGILKRPVMATAGGLEMRIIATAKDPKTGVDYAGYVHEGTRPHDIPNAFGWGLNFGIGMNLKNPREFFHPGYKGNHYLSDNLKLFFA
jgi:hypothetical protein